MNDLSLLDLVPDLALDAVSRDELVREGSDLLADLNEDDPGFFARLDAYQVSHYRVVAARTERALGML